MLLLLLSIELISLIWPCVSLGFIRGLAVNKRIPTTEQMMAATMGGIITTNTSDQVKS